MDDRELQGLLAFFHLFDIDCMVRPPTLESTRLYRYLEDGASGILIPLVSTGEKARMLVEAVKFPPVGNRGFDGAGLEVGFNLAEPVEFAKKANRETFLFVQIETPEAVENIDDIVSVEGVDGVFLGPGDMTLRLGQAGAPFTMDVARQRVAAACAKHGKVWGQPAFNEEHMGQLHQEGARLIAHGGDFPAILTFLEECSGRFDRVLGSDG